jgi:hypothetical protein
MTLAVRKKLALAAASLAAAACAIGPDLVRRHVPDLTHVGPAPVLDPPWRTSGAPELDGPLRPHAPWRPDLRVDARVLVVVLAVEGKVPAPPFVRPQVDASVAQ